MNGRRLAILFSLLILMSGAVFAHSVDVGPVTFDILLPILYINNIDALSTFASFSSSIVSDLQAAPFKILGNLRAGFEFDLLLNVVSNTLGIGFSVGALMSFGEHPNVLVGKSNVIIDMPFRAAMRIGFGQSSYFQLYTGLYLQNLVEAATDSSFDVFRYVDVGFRFKLGSFGFGGGYLIEVIQPTAGTNLNPNPTIPFYAGVYVPII